MFFHKAAQRNRGFSILEILVVVAIIGGVFVSIFTVISLSLVNASLREQTSTARLLLEEAVEAVRNFRDGTLWDTNGLGTLSLGTNYYPSQSGSPPKWTLAAGVETLSGFTRKIVFNEVRRDSNNNIVSSGGTVDSDTKKATITVSWTERGRTHQVEIQTYFSNWRN